MGTVASYESFSLQSLSHKSNAVSQRLQLELVAYESGHKESCFFFTVFGLFVSNYLNARSAN